MLVFLELLSVLKSPNGFGIPSSNTIMNPTEMQKETNEPRQVCYVHVFLGVLVDIHMPYSTGGQ